MTSAACARLRGGMLLAALFALTSLAGLLFVTGAQAATTTYSATQTIPVPPASNFAGQGGGDGWAIALSNNEVFNVFHHQGTMQVACHEQADATPCWPVRTIQDGSGNDFAVNGHPAVYYDPGTNKVFVMGTRSADNTAGVVCVDPVAAATQSNPFCGYAPLTAPGDSPLNGGLSGVSNAMLVGTRWYAYNYVNGSNVSGGKNTLLCYDFQAQAACPGQPYAVDIGSGNMSVGSFPEPATAAIGNEIIIPVRNDQDRLACFNVGTGASCAGAFPAPLSFSYASSYGSAFPMLDNSGDVTGLCLPTPGDPCFDLAGNSVATPAGMTSVINPDQPWNGPAFVLGPRVYVPHGNGNVTGDEVECWSYASGASCPNFPKTFNDLNYLYTVNPDPQRPTCIWANSDTGSAQIQSFDAFTGGPCGQGPTRVLASQFVVPQKQCQPSSYVALQVLDPARNQYSDGTIQFADADGNAIPGAGPMPLDANGAVDLSGLQLNTATGLPQFLITLNGANAASQVVVKLTWQGVDDPACAGKGITVVQPVITATAPSASHKPIVCVSTRRFVIHVQRARRYHLVSASVFVNGKRVKVTRHASKRHPFTAIVDLRNLKAGTYHVIVVGRSKSGKVRRFTRTYHTCQGKKHGGHPKL